MNGYHQPVENDTQPTLELISVRLEMSPEEIRSRIEGLQDHVGALQDELQETREKIVHYRGQIEYLESLIAPKAVEPKVEDPPQPSKLPIRESGRRIRGQSRKAIFRLLKSRLDKPMTAQEIADETGASIGTTYRYLKMWLGQKKVSNVGNKWRWLDAPTVEPRKIRQR